MAARAWNAGGFDANAARDTHNLEQRLQKMRRLSGMSRLMDTAVGIPGTRFRFGADSVLGLVPILGDGAGALVGLYIVNEARRLGLPREKIAKMIGNVAMDTVVGSVPLFGDLFDVYFKSHRRNVQIILDHFGVQPEELQRKR
ncbi:DUF4112 domain-containing protein [Agrobacterium larrymoorei]|uniref:DUF4112 domain-containing protein n=1 Tax=Agrobacterium larrymoorei TaxID=160699 RepID=UPI0030C5BDA6